MFRVEGLGLRPHKVLQLLVVRCRRVICVQVLAGVCDDTRFQGLGPRTKSPRCCFFVGGGGTGFTQRQCMIKGLGLRRRDYRFLA